MIVTLYRQVRKMHRLSKLGAVFCLSCCLATEVMSSETVQINFRDADIRSVIESVAEITGKSFVLDPRVKGKVTIISPQPIDSDLLYQAILSAIQVDRKSVV